MAREINRMRAEGVAWRLTQDYCLDTPGPTPVEDIAMDRGVLCLEANLTGCLARLVRKGNRGIIRTKAGIREDGRRRFAIAHELGHWFLHEKESQVFVCTAEQMPVMSPVLLCAIMEMGSNRQHTKISSFFIDSP